MYRFLAGRLRQLGMRQSDLGKELGIKAPAVSQRFTGRTPWSIDEMYKCLDICRAKPEEMHIYFPRGGMSA